MNINKIVELQLIDGSWKDINIIGLIFSKELENIVAKEKDITVVITYLVVMWVLKTKVGS